MAEQLALYKCISFSKPYWPYIYQEQKIRFATPVELLGGNDKQEFDHRWESPSQYFQYLVNHIKPRYDDLYLKTAILSMGMSANRRCWEEYCSQGGLRYEFEFDLDLAKSTDVTFKSVVYDDDKTFNLANFFHQRPIDLRIKDLLQTIAPRTFGGNFNLWMWMKSGVPGTLTLEHVSHEIPFKKKTEYQYEDEFRLIQLTEQIGPRPLRVKLDRHQKLNLAEIGLKLVKICTSDIAFVKKSLPDCKIEICDIGFSD